MSRRADSRCTDFRDVLETRWNYNEFTQSYHFTAAFSLKFMYGIRDEEWSDESARAVEDFVTERLRKQVYELVTPIANAVIVSDESTDFATGRCKCELCHAPIEPWFKFCPHCGAQLIGRKKCASTPANTTE